MPRTPTSDEFAEIDKHIAWFKQRWQRIPNIWECDFDGGPEDIRALSYIDDEGLQNFFKGEAQTGYGKFAMVFGNVLTCRLGFRWRVADEGSEKAFVLWHEQLADVINPRLLVWNELTRRNWKYPNFRSLFGRIASSLSAKKSTKKKTR